MNKPIDRSRDPAALVEAIAARRLDGDACEPPTFDHASGTRRPDGLGGGPSTFDDLSSRAAGRA